MRRFALFTFFMAAAACAALAPDALAHPPWGIAADGQGRVYFSALETIWKIDERGRLTVFRAGVAGRHTHELRLGEDGNLYGEDLTYEPEGARWITAAWKMTPSGEFSYLLAPTDSPPRSTSIWRDREGNSYSVQGDNNTHELTLSKRSVTGELSVLRGSRASLERVRQVTLYNAAGTAFGPDGALYFTDGTDIFKAERDGTVKTLARNVSDTTTQSKPKAVHNDHEDHGGLLGLSVDAQGNAYAADIKNRRVMKVTTDGKASVVHTSDETWMPTGVACAGESVYVLEFGTTPSGTNTPPRVLKLKPGEQPTLIASVAGARASAGGGGGVAVDYVDYRVPMRNVRRVAYVLACAVALALALVGYVFTSVRRGRRLR